MPRILVIDDHEAVRTLIRLLLERAGHAVTESVDGSEGMRRLYADQPDLVVLDLQMPELDGWGALERIRQITRVPVLVCSGVATTEARVHALTMGADDFLLKPFDGPELVARVDCLLRRAGADTGRSDVIDDGYARVDVVRHEAVVAGTRLVLTPLEFRLLGVFLRHAGMALAHEQLLDLAWGGDLGSREQVKAAVLSLRRKLGDQAPGAEDAIETVRGVGYRWRTPARDLLSRR